MSEQTPGPLRLSAIRAMKAGGRAEPYVIKAHVLGARSAHRRNWIARMVARLQRERASLPTEKAL